MTTSIQDPILIFLAKRFSHRGHVNLPLSIAKEKQSYVIGHKRKRFGDGSDFIEMVCKITPVKSSGLWKLYWKRADLKWHLYEAYPNLERMTDEVDRDPNGCFWG